MSSDTDTLIAARSEIMEVVKKHNIMFVGNIVARTESRGIIYFGTDWSGISDEALDKGCYDTLFELHDDQKMYYAFLTLGAMLTDLDTGSSMLLAFMKKFKKALGEEKYEAYIERLRSSIPAEQGAEE